MAKRMVFICDGPNCGAILVNPTDGYVLQGAIKMTAVEGDAAKTLVSSEQLGSETSLCRECMLKVLGLG